MFLLLLQDHLARMKTAMVATFAAPVLCGLLAALPTPSSAQTSTITVPFDGVDYVIDVYDAGSDTTYAVTFTDSGFESVYEFDHEGMVTAITAKKEEYSIIYRNNGNLKKVNLVAWRRQLGDASEGANNMDLGLDQTTLLGRGFVELAPAGSDTRGETKPFEKNSSPAGSRRLDECDDCVYMWDTLCDQGVETVCNLDGYGKPFLPNAETSIEGFCSNFAGMCNDNTAGDVCEDECGGDECLPPLTITLEHTGGSGVAEANVDLYVVQPGGQTAYFDNTETVRKWMTHQDRLGRPRCPAQNIFKRWRHPIPRA